MAMQPMICGRYAAGVEREKPFGRHGGDLKGISDHLNYHQRIRCNCYLATSCSGKRSAQTVISWVCYTDFYKIDRRFGSNEEYTALVDKCHNLGIKH
jgi:glycosidase